MFIFLFIIITPLILCSNNNYFMDMDPEKDSSFLRTMILADLFHSKNNIHFMTAGLRSSLLRNSIYTKTSINLNPQPFKFSPLYNFVRNTISKKNTQIEQLTAQNSQLKNSNLQKESISIQTDLSDIELQNSEYTQILKAKESEAKNLQNNLQIMEQKNLFLQQQLAELQQNDLGNRKEIDTLNRKNNHLQEQLTKLGGLFNEQLNTDQTLLLENSQNQTKILQLQSEKKDLQRENDTLTNEVGNLTLQLHFLRKLVAVSQK